LLDENKGIKSDGEAGPMINIKTKPRELIRTKDISLAMLVNKEGDILWRKGREIKEKTIDEGDGFPKSYLKRSIHNGNILEEQNIEAVKKPFYDLRRCEDER
jgi:hypothetical protein